MFRDAHQMPQPTSLYRILNVAPDADPAVIEAAYKALMKKHHPDVSGDGSAADESASRINEAFAILRDPERRARYDEEERSRTEQSRMPPLLPVVAARPIYARDYGDRRGGWAFPLMALLVAAGAIWGALAIGDAPPVALSQPEPQGADKQTPLAAAKPGAGGAGVVERAAAANTPAMPAGPVNPNIVASAIGEFRRVQEKGGLRGVVGYSSDCFWAQSHSEGVADLDFCVAFDHAASVSDSQTTNELGLPQIPHFQTQNMTARHLAAGRLLASDDAWILTRLREVGQATDDAIAAEVKEGLAAPTIVARQEARRPTRAAKRKRGRAANASRRPASQAAASAEQSDFLEREGGIY